MVIKQFILLAGFFYFSVSASGGHNPPASSFSSDPNKILEELQKGNERFVAGALNYPDADRDRRIETAAKGQNPLAIVVTCSDSRVPPELIFDCGIGTLFVIRVAGNIAEKSQVGSMEYAAGHLATPLLVVMGHTKCGAVGAAVENSEVSVPMKSVLNNIEPAIARVKKEYKDLAEEDILSKAIVENVWQTIDDIFKTSPAIRALVKTARLKVVGALYNIETGKVQQLGVHNRQYQLIKTYEAKKSGTAAPAKKK